MNDSKCSGPVRMLTQLMSDKRSVVLKIGLLSLDKTKGGRDYCT